MGAAPVMAHRRILGLVLALLGACSGMRTIPMKPMKAGVLPRSNSQGQYVHLRPDSSISPHYYLQLEVAGQPFDVIADTGSSDFALPLQGCHVVRLDGTIVNGRCGETDQQLNLSHTASKFEAQTCPERVNLPNNPCINAESQAEFCERHDYLRPGDKQFVACETHYSTFYQIPRWCPCCGGDNCTVHGTYKDACCIAEFYGVSQNPADAEGWRGILADEVVTIGSLSGKVTLSAIVEFVGSPFGPPASGILGLAFKPLAASMQPNGLFQLFDLNNSPKKFAMCMGLDSGGMTVGGVDKELYVGDMVWVDMAEVDLANGVETREFYTMVMDEIQVKYDGKTHSVSLKQGNSVQSTIVDSGTPHLVLSRSAVQQFIGAFKSICSSLQITSSAYSGQATGFSCIPPAGADMKSPPKVNMIINGKHIPWFQYAILAQDGRGTQSWQVNFQVSSSENILGVPFMQAYYTAFDIDNYKVGFATRNNASQCGNSLYTARYPSLLKLKDQGSGGFFSNKTNLILVCVAIGVFVGAVIGAIYYFWPMKPRTPAGVEMSRTGASLEEQA